MEKGIEHVPLRLGADLVRDGAKHGSVAVRESRVVRVSRVPVEGSVLGFEE